MGWRSLLACSVLFSRLAAGQTDGASQSSTTFHVTTRIVYVDVVVRDRHGRIVTGLTQKDFRLEEDGKFQAIEYFADHSTDSKLLDEPNVSAQKDRIASPSGKLEFTNVPANPVSSNAIHIILLDLLNTPLEEQAYARNQMVKFLQELPPGHQTALFVLTNHLHMIQNFTGDSAELSAAAKAIKPVAMTTLSATAQMQGADMAAEMAAAIGRTPGGTGVLDHFSEDDGAMNKIAITQAAFVQIAHALSGYRGRKNLFWLTGSLPNVTGLLIGLDDPMRLDDFRATVLHEAAGDGAVADSQFAVYPIVLTGLETSGVSAAANGASSTTSINGFNPTGMGGTLRNQFTARFEIREYVNNLADLTGGEAFFQTNDFAGALKRGFEDGDSFYSLAYRPQNRNWNGQFRKIKLHLAESGYSLSYRKGYFAQLENPHKQDATAGLAEALQPDTPESTAIAIQSKVRLPATPQAAVVVDSVIDPQHVEFATDVRGRRHGRLMVSLIALPVDAPGVLRDDEKLKTEPQQRGGLYVVDLDPDKFVAMLKDGMPMHQELTLPAGHYRLRLGVSDLASHRLGTLDMPIEIPVKP